MAYVQDSSGQWVYQDDGSNASAAMGSGYTPLDTDGGSGAIDPYTMPTDPAGIPLQGSGSYAGVGRGGAGVRGSQPAGSVNALQPYYAGPNTNGGTQDPYGVLGTTIRNQGNSYASMVSPYSDAVVNDAYSTAPQARAGIIGGQQQALDQFGQFAGGLYGGLSSANAGYDAAGNQAVSDMGSVFGQNRTLNAGNVATLTGALGQANDLDASNIYGLGQSLGQANYLDTQNIGQLGSSLDRADAMDSSNIGQLNALNGSMRQLTAGGYGADVTSNPQDVMNQQNAYDTLGGFADGSHDYTSQAADAYADPDAIAAQKEVMAKLKEQSDPKLTDAERYLYMQSRLQEEQSNRGARDANMRELERSGMGGSTMQLSNLNAGSQQTATTRSLADLGANAKAIDRASAATVNYGNLASTVSGQSFQQAYGRGQAADAASQFNTATQLQGTVAQGNEANQMRTANDALNEFNKSQSLQQRRFQDSYAADQQQQAWGRGVDVSNAGFQQSRDIATNAATKSNAGFQQSKDISTNAGILSNAGFMQSQDLSKNAGLVSDAGFKQTDASSRDAGVLGNASLTNTGQQRQSASAQAGIGAQLGGQWLTGTQNVGQMGLTAVGQNSQALGQASDAAYRQLALRQGTDSQLNAITNSQIASGAEDRRANAAKLSAEDIAQKDRDAANTPHSLLGWLI